MGRHYWGDIEGKFMFAVQPSDDADCFGVTGHQPNYLEYWFDDVEPVNEGIQKIMAELSYNMKGKLDNFFIKCMHGSDRMYGSLQDTELAEYLCVPEKQVRTYLELYARLKLGIKIRDCIVVSGQCSFEAEL